MPTTPYNPERAILTCPQCEGDGSVADGLDEAACSQPCSRCDSAGVIVDVAAINQAQANAFQASVAQ